MSSDKSSIIEKAQKLAAKGQIDKAIEEWQKLIAETPNDGNIYNTIGDLHLKANHTKDAIEAYLKAADAFRGAGFELKSIAVYKKIVKIDPSRMDVYEKLADVHAERGLVANAVEDYLRVAKHYAKGGNMQSSIAVYRKLANLDPKNFAVRQKLAEICQKWGLAKEAAEEYNKVLSIFKDRQMTSEAQQVIDQVLENSHNFTQEAAAPSGTVDVDSDRKSPSPLSSPEQEAPPHQEKSSPPNEPMITPAPEPAPEEIPALPVRMEKALQEGDWPAAEALLEELQDQPPEVFAYLEKWVDYFIERDSFPKAFSILQKAVSLAESHQLLSEGRSLIRRYLAANPEQVSAHKLLGDSFEKSGEEAEAIECHIKIISLLHQQRSITDAQTYYEQIKTRLPGISLDENCRRLFEPQEQAAVEELPSEELQAPPQTEEAEQVIEELLPQPESVSEALPEPVSIDEVSQVSSEAVLIDNISEEAPLEESPVEEISEATFQGHMTEAEVYIKYGLNSKAIEQLTLLSQLAPSREEPHLQLKELYLKEGVREKAAHECLFLSKLYEKAGAEDKRNAILEELRAIDPERQYQEKAVQEIAEEGSMPVESPAAEALEMPSSAEERVGEIGEAEPLPVGEEGDSSFAHEEESPHSEEMKTKLRQAEEYIRDGKKEAAKSLLWKILKVDSGCTEARMMLLNLQEAGKEQKETSEPAAEVEENQPPSGEEFSFEGLSELEESLDGLLSDVEGEESSENESVPEEVSSPGAGVSEREEYIDLKSIFGEELNTETEASFDLNVPGLEDSINDLRANIQRDHDEQEYETHYNLGIAYKEMGLIPEAIKEFELAFQGDHRFQDASSMLASCYKENGMIDTAIEILNNALEDPRCKKENSIALKYELALLYDIQGVRDQAKALFEEIYLIDPNFRDVAAKKSRRVEPPQDTTSPSATKSKRQDSKKKDRISYL